MFGCIGLSLCVQYSRVNCDLTASATHTAIRCKTLKFKYGCRPPSAHPVKAGHRHRAALGGERVSGAGLPPRSAHPLERTAWRRWRSQLRSAQAAARAKGRRGERRGVRRRAAWWEVRVLVGAGARCGSAMTAAGTRTQRTHAQGNTYILIYRARDCATRLRVHDARSVAHVYRSDRLAARRWPRTSSPSAQRVLMYPSTSVAFVAAPSKSSMCTLLGEG
eukprot:scaffold2869_cov69-Phaeocystis_antarctica.AAC.3